MKPFACVLIVLAALTACGQAHSVQRRSLDLLLGGKLGLLEKKLSLLGLKGQAPVYQPAYGSYGGGQAVGYAGGYGYEHAGGYSGGYGAAHGGLLEKKLSLLGVNGVSSGASPGAGYGYPGGYYNGQAGGYSSNPEKVVVVKVVSDGGYVGHSGGNSGHYYAGSAGGHGGYNGEVLAGHGVYYSGLPGGHVVTHGSSPGC